MSEQSKFWRVRKGWSSGTAEIYQPNSKVKRPFKPTSFAVIEGETPKESTAIAKELVACRNALIGFNPSAVAGVLKACFELDEAHDQDDMANDFEGWVGMENTPEHDKERYDAAIRLSKARVAFRAALDALKA